MSLKLFKTKPYKHQLEAYEQSKDREYFAILAEMGLGKTKITIDTFRYLYEEGKANGMAVVAPKSVYINWTKEIETHFSIEDYALAYYSATARKHERSGLDYILSHNRTIPTIMLINIESLSTKKGFDAIERFLEKYDSILVVDESSTIKGHKSKRTKACINLRGAAKYRRILTGTPNPQSPLDLWAQFEFLEKQLTQSVNFFAFKYTYAQVTKVDLGPGRPSYEKITGYQNIDMLQKIIEPHCVRLLKKDCLDLPDKIYTKRHVELTTEQKQHYNTLRDLAIIEHKKGELTVQSALATLAKLHQITSGFMILDNQEIATMDSAKIKELISTIDELDYDSKIIIWTNFRHELFEIAIALDKKHKDDKKYAVTYYGDTPQDARTNNIASFMNDPDCKYFISTLQCGCRGITLTSAQYAVYMSNGNNLEHRLQSEDRCHRIGQKNNVTYIDIISDALVDRKIKNNLEKKAAVAEMTLAKVKRIITLQEAIQNKPSELLNMI